MHDALPTLPTEMCRRLPNAIELGCLRKFSKLQLHREKNHHPFESGFLGTLRQKKGLKRESIYISITYSKAAKLGTLRWHPSRVGILRRPPFPPEGCQIAEGCQALSHPPSKAGFPVNRRAVALVRPDHPAREAPPPSGSPKGSSPTMSPPTPSRCTTPNVQDRKPPSLWANCLHHGAGRAPGGTQTMTMGKWIHTPPDGRQRGRERHDHEQRDRQLSGVVRRPAAARPQRGAQSS